jgi:hypothetical protein
MWILMGIITAIYTLVTIGLMLFAKAHMKRFGLNEFVAVLRWPTYLPELTITL